MLTRRTARFRTAVELAERYCREVGVDADADLVDDVARTWVARVAHDMGVTDRTALAHAPHDFGQLIADSIIRAERQTQLEQRPFGRDAVVYVPAPATGAKCSRCDLPIGDNTEAVSVLGLNGRGLAHPHCI